MHWMCRNGSIQVRRPLFASRCWLLANSLIFATGALGSVARDPGSAMTDPGFWIRRFKDSRIGD